MPVVRPYVLTTTITPKVWSPKSNDGRMADSLNTTSSLSCPMRLLPSRSGLRSPLELWRFYFSLRFVSSRFNSFLSIKLGNTYVALTITYTGSLAIQKTSPPTRARSLRQVSSPSSHVLLLTLIAIHRKLEKGHFTVTNIASSVPTDDGVPRTYVKSIMRGKGDPGYLGSAGSSDPACSPPSLPR
jgi:hypothetical protein